MPGELRALEIVSVAVDRRIGTVLGGYRIVEPLGSGGTSVVYRAEHVRLGRQAALKLLAPGLGEADFSERFLRESVPLARLGAAREVAAAIAFLASPEGNGANALEASLARVKPVGCYAQDGVDTEPGQSVVTRTPRGASSWRSASLNDRT